MMKNPPSIVVFCELDDLPALWAAGGLRRRGLEVDIVTAPALGSALRWEHRLDTAGDATVEIELGDGRSLSSARPVAVLNRLAFAPTGRLNLVAGTDRDYAIQEFNALFLSWLHSLPGPVVNRPTPQGLCGICRHRSAWAALAGRVGLPARPYRHSCADNGTSQEPPSFWQARPIVFVVGEEVVAPFAIPADLVNGCVRLAKAANETLLGIEFGRAQDGSLEVVTASPLPDLRLGGAPLVEILANVLTA